MKIFSAILLSITAHFCFAQTNLLPVEYFGSTPDVSRMQLSPDGYSLASKIRVDLEDKKGTAIQVVNLKSGEKKIVLFTDNKMFDINWIKWKGDSTLLVGIYFAEKRAEKQSLRRYKIREQRLLIVDVKTGKYYEAFARAFQEELAHFGSNQIPFVQDDVVDLLEDDPDHILMSLSVDPNFIVKVGIKNQTAVLYQERNLRVWRWIVDQQHKVRIAYEYDENSAINKIMLTASKFLDWRELWKFEDLSEGEVEVLGFGLDPNVLYINAYYHGRKAVFRVDLKSPQLTRELVLDNPERDVEGILVHSRLTRDAIGIQEANSHGITYFDNAFAKLQKGINKVLPATKNYILNTSQDERRYLVLATSDSDPGTYYVGDRDKGSLDVVAYRFKNLPVESMVKKQPYKFNARDGLEIETFLSYPAVAGAEPKNLKTIVLLHDGPVWRDDEHTDDEYLGDKYEDDLLFNTWTQFLVNRGYAVLQINYRGSSGKGINFRNAGFKNWGGSVQEDIEDGVNFFVKKGVVDKNTVGIMGSGYGGYSALYGVVKTPKVYKFAVSISGFSDVDLYAYDRTAFWLSHTWVNTVIGSNSSQLERISPSEHANEINVPVLLIHGDVDRRIDPKYSRSMFQKLKKLNKNVEYIELKNEDHFLTDNANRIKAFKAIDEFLAKYLPVKH